MQQRKKIVKLQPRKMSLICAILAELFNAMLKVRATRNYSASTL